MVIYTSLIRKIIRFVSFLERLVSSRLLLVLVLMAHVEKNADTTDIVDDELFEEWKNII